MHLTFVTYINFEGQKYTLSMVHYQPKQNYLLRGMKLMSDGRISSMIYL